MRYEKVYIEVTVKFLSDGGMRPLEMVWTTGERFRIDRVKYIDNIPSKVGSLSSRRFTVIISGLEKHLYFEELKERWFVEKRLD